MHFLYLLATANASLFFKDSKSDKLKANLESIGYDVIDSAGIVKDSIFDSIDPESLKDWLNAHGVQPAENALEVAKQHKDWLLEDIEDYARENVDFAGSILNKGKEFYSQGVGQIFDSWSDSKLKEFLDARGFNVPQHSTRDQLNALLAKAKHNLPINVNGPAGQYWFDSWSKEEIKQKLAEAGESIEGSRKELVSRLYSVYSESYKQGAEQAEDIKEEGRKLAGDFVSKLGEWKEATAETFSKWSTEDLKEYLSDFGTEVEGARERLVEAAKDQYHYFIKGEPRKKTVGEKIWSLFSTTKTSWLDRLQNLIGINSIFHNEL